MGLERGFCMHESNARRAPCPCRLLRAVGILFVSFVVCWLIWFRFARIGVHFTLYLRLFWRLLLISSLLFTLSCNVADVV